MTDHIVNQFPAARRTVIAALCLLILPFADAQAAEPDTGVLQLVGEEAGVVVEINDLDEAWPRLENCKVFRRLEQTDVYRQWQSSENFQNLEASRKAVEQLVGKPLWQFVTDLFGRTVVIAVYPDEEDKSQVVLITRAVDTASLDSAIEIWNRAERVELARSRLAGFEYVRRIRPERAGKPQPSQYYVQFGDILAFSDHESAIRRVVELRADGESRTEAAKVRGHILTLPAHRSMRQALPDKRFASLYINPRVWDDRIELDKDESKPAQFLAGLWRRCESIGFGLSVDEQGVFVEGLAHFGGDKNDTDPDQPTVAPKEDVPPSLLQHVPARAVAAVAGRHDLVGVSRLLLSWIPEKQQQDWIRIRQMGRGLLVGFDLFDDVLPALGRGWGAYAVPAADSGEGVSPLEVVVGVELPPPGEIKRGNITLRDGLNNTLETALRLVATFGTEEEAAPAEPNIEIAPAKNGGDIRFVRAANGLRPSYTFTPQHLVVGTSPDAVEEFTSVNERGSLAGDAGFQAAAEKYFPRDPHLVYVNVAALRKLIAEQEPQLSRRLAGPNADDVDASRQRLKSLGNLLEACDVAFVAAETSSRRVRLRWGIAAE